MDESSEDIIADQIVQQFTGDQSDQYQYDDKYQDLLEQVNDIVFRMSIEGRLTEVSPSVTSILGYTPEEVIGKDIQVYIQPDSLDIIRREIARKVQYPDESSRYEVPIRAQNGEPVICEIHSRLIRKPDRPLEILGIIRDTTQRRRMEDAIRTSERRYREIFENAIEGMFCCSTDGQIFDANVSFATIFGYATPEEMMNHVDHFSQLYRNSESETEGIRQVKKNQVIQNVPIEVIHKSGENRWVRMNARLVHGQNGDCIEGSVMDITEQIRLERSLAEKDRIYRLLADNITDVIWTADMEMNITYMSPSVFKLRGIPVEIASHQPIHEVYIPESLHTLQTARKKGMDDLFRGDTDGETSQYLELGMYHRDGHIIWTETVISLIFSSEHTPIGVVGSIRNISARKQVERAHQESQVRLQEAEKLAQVGNYEINIQTGYMICSDELFRIFEIERPGDRFSYIRYISYIHPDDREEVEQGFMKSIRENQAMELIHRIKMPDGRLKHLHVRGRTQYSDEKNREKIIGTMQDITERMSLEEERSKLMNQIQRNIAELSILNDGIRNPLAIIETTLEVEPDGWQDVILVQIARIDTMITQLDKRWVESEKIFTYLQKHYGITL